MSREEKNLNELKELLLDWNSTALGRRSFLISMPILLAACSSSSKHRNREGDNSGQQTSLTVDDEKKMTQEYLPEMRKEYPTLKNPWLQSYITELGQKIVNANQLHNNPYTYRFEVVEAKFVNAFALPAGTVFVTAPLLAMAGSEAELSGVIGHEIGHIKARHTAERMDQAKKDQKKSILFGAGGGLLGGAAGFGLGKLLCRKEDKKCLQNATVIGAAAGAGGGLLIQKFAFMANSREDEMEADRIGFKTAFNAGFSKDHVGLFYKKLLKMEEDAKKGTNPILASFSDAMSTHPPSKERVLQMEEMASQQKPMAKSIVSSQAFDKAKKLVESYSKS